MESKNSDGAAQSLATLMGGKEIVVQKRDGGCESVLVSQLQIEQYPELLKRLEDEAGQIELYCRSQEPGARSQETGTGSQKWVPVPAQWARTLTPASHDLVMTEAETLNKDFFSRWLRRKLEKVEVIRPGFTERMFGESISRGSLPKSALNPALPSNRPGSIPSAS